METLRLPEPAGTLWRRCRSVIEACFGNDTRDDGGFVLTGGTILAARFDHRTSTDIDVLITSCDSLTDYFRGGRRHQQLTDALRHIGLTHHEPRPPHQLTFVHPAQQLDLFASQPFPHEPPRHAAIDGHQAAVASTHQILSGKLRGRALRAPVRDLIDLSVSAERDPHACERAINSINATILGPLPSIWERARANYQSEARDDRVIVQPDWKEIQADPALHAVNAIRAFVWRQIDVMYTPHGAFFTGYRPGETHRLNSDPITTPAGLDTMLERYGIPYGIDHSAGRSHPAGRMLEAMTSNAFVVTLLKDVQFDGEPTHRAAILDPDARRDAWSQTADPEHGTRERPEPIRTNSPADDSA